MLEEAINNGACRALPPSLIQGHIPILCKRSGVARDLILPDKGPSRCKPRTMRQRRGSPAGLGRCYTMLWMPPKQASSRTLDWGLAHLQSHRTAAMWMIKGKGDRGRRAAMLRAPQHIRRLLLSSPSLAPDFLCPPGKVPPACICEP